MKFEIGLTYKKLRKVAYGYITLPVLIFLGGFVRWYYAIPAIAALVVSLYFGVTRENVEQQHQDKTVIKISGLIGVFLFVLLWTYLGGMNGYFYQTTDWNCRNAIYHDLIQFEWPVVYESTGAALVYYIGHWLPPAFVGKLVLWATGSMRWAWFIGRMALWGWSSLGLTLVILLMFHYLHISSTRKQCAAVLIFVFFSGMDVIGSIQNQNLDQLLSPDSLHLEWWQDSLQFSSITTCIYWVFNQIIVPWIITLCFLIEDDPQNYVLCCVSCLLCGPFPCIGLVICMVIKALYWAMRQIRSGIWKKVPRCVFSVGNILSVLFVFPIVAAYILANNAIGALKSEEIALVQQAFFSKEYWTATLIQFLFLEAGCYMILIFCDRKRDLIYYAICLTFIISPYFHIGAGVDFCMRASVPAVFILMLYVNHYLLEHFTLNPKHYLSAPKAKLFRQILALFLAVCFVIGAVTPVVEIYRGFYHVITKGTVRLADMSIGSFDNGTVYLNFNATNPEKTFFFKFLAK